MSELASRRAKGGRSVRLGERRGPEGRTVIVQTSDDTALEVTEAARAHGYDLLQRELDTGQVAWTWFSTRDEPQPRFLTRREAIAFMSGRLETRHD
jgi:hypothetical protein